MNQVKRILGVVWIILSLVAAYFCIAVFGWPKFTSGKQDLALGYATGNPPPGILHFLYDEVNDPQETHNLAGEPDKKIIILDLQQKMLRVFEQTHPKGKLPGTLSTDEKLSIYCDPPELAAN